MASIRRTRTGQWRARWRTPDGKSRSKTFTHKRDAERHCRQVEHTKDVGTYVDSAAGRVTFRAFAEEWLAVQTFDESTREAVASRLRVHAYPTLRHRQLRTIRPSTMQAWLRGLQGRFAPSYASVLLANVSVILAAAVEDGLIGRNPCASSAVKAPRVDQSKVVPWSLEQVEAVVAAHPAPYRAIPIVGARSGPASGRDLRVARQRRRLPRAQAAYAAAGEVARGEADACTSQERKDAGGAACRDRRRSAGGATAALAGDRRRARSRAASTSR